MGTVSYMSPEQARGLDVDERTDIFSLGVLVYEMIAGTKPFEGNTNADVIASLLTTEPAPFRGREVPAELDRIVRKCLSKDCESRYRSAQELLDDLEHLSRELPRASSEACPTPSLKVIAGASTLRNEGRQRCAGSGSGSLEPARFSRAV